MAIAVLVNQEKETFRIPYNTRKPGICGQRKVTVEQVLKKYPKVTRRTLRTYRAKYRADIASEYLGRSLGMAPFEELEDWVREMSIRGRKRYMTDAGEHDVAVWFEFAQKSDLARLGRPMKIRRLAQMMTVIHENTTQYKKLCSRSAVDSFLKRHPDIFRDIAKPVELARKKACTPKNAVKHFQVKLFGC